MSSVVGRVDGKSFHRKNSKLIFLRDGSQDALCFFVQRLQWSGEIDRDGLLNNVALRCNLKAIEDRPRNFEPQIKEADDT
ncbi:hypothetical protein TNCV_2495001 [Trichonephila clavipes]|nr:hypothetical protein TNCV_2495001 [Trichonephila clavipes]